MRIWPPTPENRCLGKCPQPVDGARCRGNLNLPTDAINGTADITCDRCGHAWNMGEWIDLRDAMAKAAQEGAAA